MQSKIGAEHLEQVPSLAHRPDGGSSEWPGLPVGPTDAVDAVTGAVTGAVACGIKPDGWRCWTRTGRTHSSRSALAVSRPWRPRASVLVTTASG
jgi:hypothetical protein